MHKGGGGVVAGINCRGPVRGAVAPATRPGQQLRHGAKKIRSQTSQRRQVCRRKTTPDASLTYAPDSEIYLPSSAHLYLDPRGSSPYPAAFSRLRQFSSTEKKEASWCCQDGLLRLLVSFDHALPSRLGSPQNCQRPSRISCPALLTSWIAASSTSGLAH